MKKSCVKIVVLILALILLITGSSPLRAKEKPPKFELFLITGWKGRPYSSPVTSTKKIPLKKYEIVMDKPLQRVYGYLLITCNNEKQWNEWRKTASKRHLVRDIRRARPKGAQDWVLTNFVNLNKFLFATNVKDPKKRAFAMKAYMKEKRLICYAFTIWTMRKPPKKFIGLRYPLIFRDNVVRKTIVEVWLRYKPETK